MCLDGQGLYSQPNFHSDAITHIVNHSFSITFCCWELCCNKFVKRNHLHLQWFMVSCFTDFSLDALSHMIQYPSMTAKRWYNFCVWHGWIRLPNYTFKFGLNKCGSELWSMSKLNNRTKTRMTQEDETSLTLWSSVTVKNKISFF